MKLPSRIRPISYLKANTAEIVRQLGEVKEPMIITQSGDAKIVVQGMESYEETEETLALLKMLMLGKRQVAEGRLTPADRVRGKIRLSGSPE